MTNRLLCSLVLGALLLSACGAENQTPTSTAEPSATPIPAASASAAPPSQTPFLPTASVSPQTTASPAAVDVPDLEQGMAAPTAAPTVQQTGSVDERLPVLISIPSLGIQQEPVPVGLDAQRVPIVPKHDVGWYTFSARPGEGDNVVFWGHVLRWKDSPSIPAPFAAIKDVEIGAEVQVQTAGGAVHRYRVSKVVWATPDQVQYILPTGKEQLTLVSCIGDKVINNGAVELSHRQITIAEPVQ